MSSDNGPSRKGPGAPAGGSTPARPIDMDRVRHLLKTTRHGGGRGQRGQTSAAAPAATPASSTPATGRRLELFQGGPKPASGPPKVEVAPAKSLPAPKAPVLKDIKPASASPAPPAPARVSTPAPALSAKGKAAPVRPRPPKTPAPPEHDNAPSAAGSGGGAPDGDTRQRKAPRKPLPPLRPDVPSDSYWFAAQPEIQRLRQDYGEAVTGWGEGEEAEAGDEPLEPHQAEPGEADAPQAPRPPRTFREADHDTWFAHQPEVQRLISDREAPAPVYFADDPGPPAPYQSAPYQSAPYQSAPYEEDHWARGEPEFDPDPRSGAYEQMFDTSVGKPQARGSAPPQAFEVHGDFSAFGHGSRRQLDDGQFDDDQPSDWFSAQPEFQRMRAGGPQPRQSGGGALRWSFLLVGAAAVAAVLWFVDVRALVGQLDIDALVAQLRQLTAGEPGQQPNVVVEPTVANAPAIQAGRAPDPAVRPAPPSSQPVRDTAGQRAPTARGLAPTGVLADTQTPGITVLARRSGLGAAVPAGASEVAAPSPVVADPPIAAPPPSDGGTGAGANQSIFVPTARTPPSAERPPIAAPGGAPDATPGGASEADPFSSFSIDGDARPARPPADPADGVAIPGLDAIERGAVIQADQIAAHVAEAQSLFVERDFDGAGRLLRDILASDPNNVPALKLYGDILMRERKFGPALEVFDAVIAADPDDTRTHVNRGIVLLALGRESAAIAAADAALALAPSTLAAVELRSKANAAAGNMPAAMAGCEEVDGLSNSKSSVEWCRAAAQNQSGNNFVAVRMFIAALNTGEQGFVRAKQVLVRDLGLYDGPVDGLSSQALIDAVTSCAVARDCIL